MSTAMSARRAEIHAWRIRMTAVPAAPAEARGHVRAAVCAWRIPVNVDTAVLLTSELVTNTIPAAPGQAITLTVACNRSRLRIEVHDSAPAMPEPAAAPADADGGRGLILVAALAAEWGFYRTLTGKAVYFTLAFERLVRVLTVVAEGGGDWDARWIDITVDSRYGPGTGTVLEELQALQRVGLVVRDDSRSGVGGRWNVTAAARPYIR